MFSFFSIDSPLFNMINKVLYLMWLSILWFICCIPIVTIGASTTALYYVTLKLARNEEGYLTSSFFQAFRQNFKQGTIIWLIIMAVGAFLGFGVILYFRLNQTGVINLLFMTLFFSVALAFALVNLYVYAVLAKFENSIRRILINSLIMALSHWPSSIAMLMLSFAYLALGFKVFPPLLFFTPAALCYIHSRFLVKIFDKYTVAKVEETGMLAETEQTTE